MFDRFKFKEFEWLDNFKFRDIDTIEGESCRLYKVEKDLHLPSMTSILHVLEEEGFLDEWRARVGEEEADRIVKEAVDRGESLHLLSENYLQNKLKKEDVKGPGKILFNRVKTHLDRLGPIVGVEVALYSKEHGYAGRCDCISFDDERHLCIVDHKNTRHAFDMKKLYSKQKMFKYMLQCTGYAIAFHEMSGFMPSHGILIVGNHIKTTSDRFKFPLAPLVKELEILVDIYYGRRPKEDSAYFRIV